MAISILTGHVQSIDRFVKSTTTKSSTLVKSFDLVSFIYLSRANEAICQVRDLATGEIRQTLASKLLPISFGKDAYLLELTSAVGGQE